MNRLLIFGIMALQCFSASACKDQKPGENKSLSIVVQKDSIVDFHKLLEAIKLLVSQQAVSLRIPGVPHDRTLSFISSNGFPGDPVLIHISPDQVAIGSGASRVSLTVDELQKHLAGFADAASKADSKGIVQLISDRQVSGDFGLAILKAIADSGIAIVMLSNPDLLEAPASTPSKKPSSPFSNNKMQKVRDTTGENPAN